MSLEDFFDELYREDIVESYIVTLKYKYDCEKEYTIENEILLAENGDYCWLNDWNEGQTDVEVIGYIPVRKVDTSQYKPEQEDK